ncbi:MAG: hypothetical protein E7425_12920 [Ruminococcaceae bacterium]|nr:hypothetical protein [Oscillospiraceae bacterium]
MKYVILDATKLEAVVNDWCVGEEPDVVYSGMEGITAAYTGYDGTDYSGSEPPTEPGDYKLTLSCGKLKSEPYYFHVNKPGVDAEYYYDEATGFEVWFSVSAPKGSLLIMARYDGGRLVSVSAFRLMNSKTSGVKKTGEDWPGDYKLMLVDGTTFAPLCAPCVPYDPMGI